MTGVRFLAGIRRISLLLHSVHSGSGVHLDLYPMGTMGSVPGGKAAEA
jgi:hypothetical protein